MVLAILALLFASACAYLLTYIVSAVKSRSAPLLNNVHYYARSHRVARSVMDLARWRALARQRREDVLTERRAEKLCASVSGVPRDIAQLIAEMSRTDFEKLVPPPSTSTTHDSNGDEDDADSSENDTRTGDDAGGISINGRQDVHTGEELERAYVTASGTFDVETRDSSPSTGSLNMV